MLIVICYPAIDNMGWLTWNITKTRYFKMCLISQSSAQWSNNKRSRVLWSRNLLPPLSLLYIPSLSTESFLVTFKHTIFKIRVHSSKESSSINISLKKFIPTFVSQYLILETISCCITDFMILLSQVFFSLQIQLRTPLDIYLIVCSTKGSIIYPVLHLAK